MNEEILGGLRNAVGRGESLNKAMMTFFNAGYKKEEIEEAARFMNQNPIKVSQPIQQEKPKENFFTKMFSEKNKPEKSPVPVAKPVSPQPSSQPIPQAIIPDVSKAPKSILQSTQPVSNYGENKNNSIAQPVAQKVSDYGNEGIKDRVAIVILIVVLVILIGLLASVFLFKQEITNFLSGLFG